MKTGFFALPGLFAALLLTGCSFAPDYVRPSLELPATWGEASTRQGLEIQWWKRFNDPVLDQLVSEALANNKNVDIAMARVDQARAYLGYSRAAQFPSVAAAGSGARARSSEDSATYAMSEGLMNLQRGLSQLSGGLIPGPSGDPAREGEQWSAALQAVWELDLWGKYRNATAAAREQMLATEAAQRGVLLGLAAQAATSYFSLRNYDMQLAIAERTLRTREEALNIYQARLDEGLISELDFLRAKTETDAMRANVYTAQYQVATAETALMVLIGRSPRDIFEAAPPRGKSIDELPDVPQLPAGLPSELLERRPDILAQEALLRAANFNIGAARAAWFPSISLTGQLGVQSGSLENLFHSGTDIWAYSGNVSLPLLTFGRISNNVRRTEAATREAAAAYGQTVQRAFQEVRDALVIQAKTAEIEHSLALAVKNLREAVALARLRYENGYAGYLDVLDAERSLFDAEIQLTNIRTNHLSSIVQVCMALGGGWTEGTGETEASSSPSPQEEK